MARAVFRNAFAALILGTGLIASSAFAQGFSEGYEFLKAVKDRDGTAVTAALETTNGSIVNTRDISTGGTALHVVTERRDALWIRFLTGKGANPNIADSKGMTPLMIAANLGFFDGVEALIKAGANVDVANSTGETPLITAVHQRNIPLVRLLLSNGASVDRSDNSGRNARDYAVLQGGGSRVLAEIEQAEKDRKDTKSGPSYGPSF